jgi:hypothetical protein
MLFFMSVRAESRTYYFRFQYISTTLNMTNCKKVLFLFANDLFNSEHNEEIGILYLTIFYFTLSA